MTKEVALTILEHHNRWRRGEDIPMMKPQMIGQAIDKAVELLKQEEDICNCKHPSIDSRLYCEKCNKQYN